MFECRTNRSVLEWNIMTYNSDGSLNTTRSRFISSIGQVVRPQSLFGTGTYNFTVSRNSMYGSLPLISTLLATDITSDLNGTMIYCTEEAAATLATTIHVISDTSTINLRLVWFISIRQRVFDYRLLHFMASLFISHYT